MNQIMTGVLISIITFIVLDLWVNEGRKVRKMV